MGLVMLCMKPAAVRCKKAFKKGELQLAPLVPLLNYISMEPKEQTSNNPLLSISVQRGGISLVIEKPPQQQKQQQ